MFITILFLYMRLRKSNILSLKMVHGLTTYVPPMEEDFTMLEKTNKGGRENIKGEVNKYDKKKLPAKAKFPLRTIEINEVFLKHCQDFFLEYDFFFMLFTVVLLLFVVTQIASMLNLVDSSNLCFYMLLFLLFMAQVNLLKNTFHLGYCRFSDETKMQMVLAFKAFLTIFLSLKYIGCSTLFDFDLDTAHDRTLDRLNQVLVLFGGTLQLPREFTYAFVAAMGALITMCLMRLAQRLAYYFFVLAKNRALARSSPDQRKYRNLLILMYLNILSPLLISVLFLTPLVESLVVPSYLSVSTWKLLRMTVIVVTTCIRMLTFREELQFYFNESYFLVQQLMADKNEKVFRYIKLRISDNFRKTWYTVFEHLCNLALPMLLLLCYVQRLLAIPE